MYDVIVVGAGPGGAIASIHLARNGQNVLLVDKASFPRDKVCGDAISGKSVELLRDMGLLDRLDRAEGIGSWGMILSGAYGASVEVPYPLKDAQGGPPGYICQRETYDRVLYEAAVDEGVKIWPETKLISLLKDGETVKGVRVERNGETQDIVAPLVIGADGAYSAVGRELGLPQLNEDHYFASVRGYYTGVTGFHPGNYVELHFVKEAAPGYLWIFPMANGLANVGIVIVSSRVKERRIRLKPLLEELVDQPRFRHRFTNAQRVGKLQGWGLPLGSKPRQMAGDGWMLVGDAASLIDPFSGEGIGNAMVSGLYAARRAVQAKEAADYSKGFLGQYEQDLTDHLADEMRLGYLLQRLSKWKWPLNYIVRKASRSDELRETMTQMFDDLEERKKLISPGFYLRFLLS